MISTLEAPGWKWVGFLGGIGFAVGFFGPMILVPEANQGPMVGIFITGPGGALLGLILTRLMKFLSVSARAQWRLLVGICLIGTVSTLLIVQPEPARLGFIVEIRPFDRLMIYNQSAVFGQIRRAQKESGHYFCG
jgi:hypothetical protein